MMRTIAWAALLALASLEGAPLRAQDVAAPDYTDSESWLCRPGRIDACASDQTVTVVRGDGSTEVQALVPDADPAFDCFYVYPTVSLDETANSDMHADQEELRVAHAQAARFRQHCRVFAPLYRQVTLTALRAAMLGSPMQADRAMAYGDVRAAWEDYLARDNDGRGVVLIGHSQGSGVLRQMLSDMTDAGERSKVVSALLIGTNVMRSADGDEGDFAWMPACESADQAGCVVSYVTFRDTVPPPAQSRFGKAGEDGKRAVCVDPAALMGHADAAHAIFSTRGVGTSSEPMTEWAAGRPLPTTPFTAAPGLIRTNCVSQGDFDYLAVTVQSDPSDPRVDDITGDVVAGGTRLDDWGLHLIDMPVVMGDLVALTARQYTAWSAEQQ